VVGGIVVVDVVDVEVVEVVDVVLVVLEQSIDAFTTALVTTKEVEQIQGVFKI